MQFIVNSGGVSVASTRNPAYQTALRAFEAVIQKAANVRAGITGTAAKGKAILVYIAQGRKMDRVMIGHVSKEQVKRSNVQFFVDLKTGNIFGAKSEVLANLNWWYGDIYHLDQWSFANLDNPEPREKDKFRVVKVYGGHTHYLPKNVHKRMSERQKPLNKSPKRKQGRPARLSAAK